MGFRPVDPPKAPPVGHLGQIRWLFASDEPAAAKLLDACGFISLVGFDPDKVQEFLEALLAHHGKPAGKGNHLLDRKLRLPGTGIDPLHALEDLGATARTLFPQAFPAGDEQVPHQPAFVHAFAGLLHRADWIGSDERLFPVRDEGPGRITRAAGEADKAIELTGALAARSWRGMGADQAQFAKAFSGKSPRPFQIAVARAPGNLVVVDAETGAGKTEAALWRFLRLASEGTVDGLYFALPTRVAARQVHARITDMAKAVWPENPPLVVLATPGDAQGSETAQLPPSMTGTITHLYDADNFENGQPDIDPIALWASERPKRYLAAPIAVGTIDQALLSVIRTRHAHLRATGLLGKLLVIDEVHASDSYMTRLTLELLHRHHAIGGQALLLSATLGATARATLLKAPDTALLRDPHPPSLTQALAQTYPSISRNVGGLEHLEAAGGSGQSKHVAMELRPWLDEPRLIAEQALASARAGARVLVVRNTVDAAVAVFEEVEAALPPDHPLLFRVNRTATLHHGRFSREDRAEMDRAVTSALGKDANRGSGLVLVGPQTLEQSLDIDADLLIADLCPADVLLQRIGRPHRHDRARPVGFETARTIVPGPEGGDLSGCLNRPRHGLGMFMHKGIPQSGVFENLLAVEATRRLIAGKPIWSISAMNRELVETSTHPEALEALLEQLVHGEPKWQAHGMGNFGLRLARSGSAAAVGIDRTKRFIDLVEVSWSGEEERFLPRLGLDSRVVEFEDVEAPTGPFGVKARRITIPAHWTSTLDPAVAEPWRPRNIRQMPGGFCFEAWGLGFGYDRRGLRRE